MWKKAFLIAACAFLISGCKTPPVYKPMESSGGYVDMQLNDDTYKVTFRGDNYYNVRDFLLRRCAEVTKMSGYEYFVLISNSQQTFETKDIEPASVSTTVTEKESKEHTNNKNDLDISKRTTEMATTTTYSSQKVHIQDTYQETAVIKMLHSKEGQKELYTVSDILNNPRFNRNF